MNEKSFSIGSLYPVIYRVISDGDVFPVIVNGSSMLPLLRHGLDTVYFSSIEGRKIRRGDIVLFERNDGKFVMHRVYKVHKNGTFSFVGDNQVAIEHNVTKDMLRAYVPFVIRKGKKINCEKGFVRTVMIMYMLLRTKHHRLAYGILNIIYKISKLFSK